MPWPLLRATSASMTLTVLIADDSEMIRRSIRRVIDEEPSIHIVGEAEDFAGAISMCHDLQPDILLLDLHMPDDRTLLPCYIKSSLQPLGSKTRVIGISLSSDEDEQTCALGRSLGAYRVLNKANFYDELVPVILAPKLATT